MTPIRVQDEFPEGHPLAGCTVQQLPEGKWCYAIEDADGRHYGLRLSAAARAERLLVVESLPHGRKATVNGVGYFTDLNGSLEPTTAPSER